MDWASKELVGLIYHLLPGFVTAWVFYALTPHPRLDAFERVVQALIFTIIVQAVTIVTVKPVAAVVLTWTEDAGLVASVIVAVLLGLLFAWLANSDRPHVWLRRMTLTTRTSFPSEWFGAFHREKRWVILNLTGDRRLYGCRKSGPTVRTKDILSSPNLNGCWTRANVFPFSMRRASLSV